MIKSAPLDSEYISEIEIESEIHGWMQDNGYPVDLTNRAYTVISESGSGYLVYEVETLAKPIDRADSVVDSMTVWLCTCADMRFRRVPDFSEGSPKDISQCKHCIAARKELRAENDENQQTL
jgi:hypothetical protein